MDEIHKKINIQIYTALRFMGANMELLAIVGSYHDTQSDEDILEMLTQYNEKGTCMSEVISSSDAEQLKPRRTH